MLKDSINGLNEHNGSSSGLGFWVWTPSVRTLLPRFSICLPSVIRPLALRRHLNLPTTAGGALNHPRAATVGIELLLTPFHAFAPESPSSSFCLSRRPPLTSPSTVLKLMELIGVFDCSSCPPLSHRCLSYRHLHWLNHQPPLPDSHPSRLFGLRSLSRQVRVPRD